MEVVDVSSAMLRQVGYEAAQEQLFVQFNNGNVYRYDSVPPSLYQSLLTAKSVGSFYNSRIKDKFQSARIARMPAATLSPTPVPAAVEEEVDAVPVVAPPVRPPAPYGTLKSGNVELPRKAPSNHPLIPPITPAYIFPDYVSDILADIIENKRVCLTGHNGTGKSSVFKQIAARIRQPVLRVNLNGQMSISDFMGFWTVRNQQTEWVDGVLPTAMRAGYWLILDEMDFADPNILAAINAVLEPGESLMLKENGNEVVQPHPDFRLFATANTIGTMSEFRSLYQGANLMNEAFMDRWRVYHIQYLSANQESKILQERFPQLQKFVGSMVQVANMVREAFVKEELSCTFSIRRLIDWAEMTERKGSPNEAARLVIFSKLNRQDIQVVDGILNNVFKKGG